MGQVPQGRPGHGPIYQGLCTTPYVVGVGGGQAPRKGHEMTLPNMIPYLVELASHDSRRMSPEVDWTYQALCALGAQIALDWYDDRHLWRELQIAAITCHHCTPEENQP